MEPSFAAMGAMGFDAVALGVGTQRRCNCLHGHLSTGREARKVHIANGLSYENADAARLSAATALYPDLPKSVRRELGECP
mgnify:CR=1 FL=1